MTDRGERMNFLYSICVVNREGIMVDRLTMHREQNFKNYLATNNRIGIKTVKIGKIVFISLLDMIYGVPVCEWQRNIDGFQ